MDVNILKSQIKNNDPAHFYIFAGSEWKIQQIYLHKMAESFHKEYKYIDSVSQLFSKLNAGSRSFISKSYIYVVRDDTEFINNENMQLAIEKIIGENILILLLTNPDKRTKFYKKYESYMCLFDSLPASILKKYIEKEIKLSDQNCEKLMELCEYDYGRCLLEIDKINQYRKGYGENDIFDNDAFSLLLKGGLIYQPPKDAIFEFVDAILDRDRKAFDLYEDCKAVNEATMVMISVLYNNTKATLQVQSYEGSDITKGTGLTSYQVMGARKHAGKRKNSDLVNIMRLCQECQEDIVTGRMEEEYVMDYLLGEIL